MISVEKAAFLVHITDAKNPAGSRVALFCVVFFSFFSKITRLADRLWADVTNFLNLSARLNYEIKQNVFCFFSSENQFSTR